MRVARSGHGRSRHGPWTRAREGAWADLAHGAFAPSPDSPPVSDTPTAIFSSAARSGPAARWSRWVARERSRPRWSIPARIAVFGLAAFLYLFEVTRNGYGDYFYAAAVKTGTYHLKSAFFGALTPANFITVDKPPLFLWDQELFSRIFGFGSWSLLAPEALMGLGSAMVLYHLVRKWVGERSAVLATAAFALTPVAVLMFRLNTPDGPMTFLLLCAAWALWSALETAKTSRLMVSGALLGAAFLVKMLEAWIVVPVFAAVYLVAGGPGLPRRIAQVAMGGAAMLASAGWWVATVALWPASGRPFVSGTADNSILSLIFGYNGFSRLSGSHSGPPVSLSALYRVFTEPYGGQIGWLLPLAVAGLAVGLWVTRAKDRCDLRRAGYILWGGWAVVYIGVLSGVQGLIHPYYTVVLAPPAAALAAAGALEMWTQRSRSHWALALSAAVGLSALWAAFLLLAPPQYHSPVLLEVPTAGLTGTMGIYAAARGWLRGRWAIGAVAVLCLIGPGLGMASFDAVTLSTNYHLDGQPLHGTMQTTPQAGPLMGIIVPRYTGPANRAARTERVTPRTARGLLAYVARHRGRARFVLAVRTSRLAASYVLEGSGPVMAIGGWNTTTDVPAPKQFVQFVERGQVHYVLVSGSLRSCVENSTGPAPCVAPAIFHWVETHGRLVTPSAYGGPISTGELWYVGRTAPRYTSAAATTGAGSGHGERTTADRSSPCPPYGHGCLCLSTADSSGVASTSTELSTHVIVQ